MKQLFLILYMSVIFNSSVIGQEELSENIKKEILDCLAEIGKDILHRNKSLALHSKWYDYFDPLGIIFGWINGIHYNKHRIR